MPEATEVAAEVTKPTASERFIAAKAASDLAKTPEAIAAKAVADAKAAPPAAVEGEKRPSGDERKFRRLLSKRDQEIGEMRAKLEALTPKAAAAAAVTTDANAAPKRADFASDELFNDAKIAHGIKKELEKTTAAAAQSKEIADTLTAYNEKIAKSPEKYSDWAETLEAGKGGALSVDLGKECPSLMWAIASSPYADDCFYAFLKDAKQLQNLIDTYKSGPKGEIAAITAFHRLEGRVGKDAPVKATEKAVAQKADDAVARPAKPKPSAEVAVRGGAAAPDGKPPLFLPGTHTLNPAYQVWKRQQVAKN